MHDIPERRLDARYEYGADFFVLRTPLLPIDTITDWAAGLRARTAWTSGGDLPTAVEYDWSLLGTRLTAFLERPECREALAVGATELAPQLDSGIMSGDGGDAYRVRSALVRYLLRMASRPTPFGLFAGCSTGTIEASTRLYVPPLAQLRRYSRLDMGFIAGLCDALCALPEVRDALEYSPNSSLYELAGEMRYVRYAVDAEQRRSFRLVSIEPNEYVGRVLTMAVGGSTRRALANGLVEDAISASEALQFIDELIECQLLVPHLQPAITGAPALEVLITDLRAGAARPVAELLAVVQSKLAELDAYPLGASRERYDEVARVLEHLPVRCDRRRLFHVDLHKPAGATTLGTNVVTDIVRGAAILRLATQERWGAERTSAILNLSAFRRAFREKYGDDEVPLLVALDEENGVRWRAEGEPRETDAPRNVPQPRHRPRIGEPNHQAEYPALYMALLEVLNEGRDELDLTPIVSRAATPPSRHPGSYAALVRLANSAPQGEQNNDPYRIYLRAVAPAGGAAWMTRFCHGDPTLREYLRRHLAREEADYPDAILADVVHLPAARGGTVVARPLIRPYEISYLGRSGASAARQIPISDLTVSVVNEHIVLRSRHLARVVLPRPTPAHFPVRGLDLPAYEFLRHLQFQGNPSLEWRWGELEAFPFLPRVVSGSIVYATARWLITDRELEAMGAPTRAQRFDEVQRVRERRRLPRWVGISDGTDELALDLDNVYCTELLPVLLRRQARPWLVEVFPSPEQMPVTGPDGRFASELIVPYRVEGVSSSVPPGQREGTATRAVRHAPGSEWLYLKIYTGPATADRLLRTAIREIRDQSMACGLIDRWFFIRYADPEWHLRVRFHGAPVALLSRLLPIVHARLEPHVASGAVDRIVIDTYAPESERYGGPDGRTLAEQIFHADSDCVIELLSVFPEETLTTERWRLALAGIDRYFDDFGLDAARKLAMLTSLRSRYGDEPRFGRDAGVRRMVGSKFREERYEVAAFLNGRTEASAEYTRAMRALAGRTRRVSPLIAELRECEARGALHRPLTEVAESVIHMHVNRVLRARHVLDEFTLYELLLKHHRSVDARSVQDGDRRLETAPGSGDARLAAASRQPR